MRNKREAAREDLRKRLIDADEARIAAAGLARLKARAVTQDAGCALGALYTAFEDLDRLVLLVNSRSLARLGAALAAAVPEAAEPKAKLQALAQAYVGFAMQNFQLWSAMFSHWLPEGVETPEWHRAEHAVPIAQIAGPLSALRPDLEPSDVLASEVQALVEAMTWGLAA